MTFFMHFYTIYVGIGLTLFDTRSIIITGTIPIIIIVRLVPPYNGRVGAFLLKGESYMYMRLVKGLNPEHLMSEFNIIAPKFVDPQIRWVDDTTLYIYGEEATPEWEKEEETHPGTGRHCCECGHYEWGRGFCTFCKGIDHMTPACEKFDIKAKCPSEVKAMS